MIFIKYCESLPVRITNQSEEEKIDATSMNHEVVELIKGIRNFVNPYGVYHLSDQHKKMIKWRAANDLTESGITKADTIFHCLMSQKGARVEERLIAIKYSIFNAFKYFDEGGRECLSSKGGRDKYFWEMADDPKLSEEIKGLIDGQLKMKLTFHELLKFEGPESSKKFYEPQQPVVTPPHVHRPNPRVARPHRRLGARP